MQRSLMMLTVSRTCPPRARRLLQQSQPQAQPNRPTIGDRKDYQQDRIANGVDSGQLTAGETRNLGIARSRMSNREVSEDDRA